MFNPDIHHRQSIRLREYDYSAAGAYCVTICTQGRECLFGEIRDGAMLLNEVGRMSERIWTELPEHYAGVVVDKYVVMPNHFHGIIFLVGAAPCGRPDLSDLLAPCGRPQGMHPQNVGAGPCACPNEGHPQGKGHPQGGAPTLSLFDVVHRFKSLTTARYRQGVKDNNWPPFPGRVWQRNYYERIIRDEAELAAIREYIAANPAKWDEDKENPDL